MHVNSTISKMCVDSSWDSGTYDPFSPDSGAIMQRREMLYHYNDEGQLVDENENVVEES